MLFGFQEPTAKSVSLPTRIPAGAEYLRPSDFVVPGALPRLAGLFDGIIVGQRLPMVEGPCMPISG